MTSSVFPDINVWVALALVAHVHHATARTWYESRASDTQLIFCRFTQLGLLRLLTTVAVSGDRTLTQNQAWAVYDRFIVGGCVLIDEPPVTEALFRNYSSGLTASPKAWADAYLLAFAEAGNLALVTFDRALSNRSERVVLLS